jgi:hypothetical protein
MDPRNLNQSSIRAAITVAAAVVIGLTMIGCLLGWLAPSLAGNTRPHPALTGTVGNAVSILVTNLRVLAIPFLLAGLGLGRSRTGRLVGDIALGLLTAASTLLVGVQLGRWQSQLIPFIPQLPIEWAALAVSLSAWVLVRDRSRGHRQLLILAMVAVALVVVAAGVETGNRFPGGGRQWFPVRILRHLRPGAARSLVPFPSHRSVPPGLCWWR